MKSWTFLVLSLFPQFLADRSFKISLANLDSDKSLLEQIYERAEAMGFDFKGLSSHHIKLSDSLVSDSKLEGEKPSAETKSASKGKKESQKASGNETGDNKSGGSKKDQSKTNLKPKNKAVADSDKVAKAQSRSEKAKSTAAIKNKTKSAKVSASSKSMAPKSVSKSKKKSTSTSSVSKSPKSSIDKKSSIHHKNSSIAPHKTKSKHSKNLSSQVESRKKSTSSENQASIAGTRSETVSASFSRSKSPKNMSESHKFSSSKTSEIGDNYNNQSKSTSDTDGSRFSSSATSTYSVPSSISANEEVLDKINSLSPDVVQSVIGTCTQCAKVNDILVYKDGDVYRDYFNKIEMRNVNGVLQDKSGAFIGKDCSCKKEKIPELGTVGPTGLVQDKEISYEQCQSQSIFMSQLASAAGQPLSSTQANSISPQSSLAQSDYQNNSYSQAFASASNQSLQATEQPMHPVSSASSDGSNSVANNAVQSSELPASVPQTLNPYQQHSSIMPMQESNINQQTAFPQQNAQNSQTSDPQFVIHGLKFHYDEPKELVCEEEDEEYCPASKPKLKTKVSTVTLIEQKTLPPKTVVKTITRMVVPETVVKTSTHILKAEPITITQKPDTVVKYVTPKTVTKLRQIPPETVTVTRTKVKRVKSDTNSEDRYVAPSLEYKKSNDVPEIESEEESFTEKDLKTPKGVECVPDCSCEEEQNCETDCQEIRCEIVE